MNLKGNVRCLVFVAVAATAGLSVTAVAGERISGTNREAAQVLNAILRDQSVALDPCVVSSNWMISHPIPADLARRYLGLNLRADLLASVGEERPAAVIDPSGKVKSAFCTNAEAQQHRARRLADFRSGALIIHKEPGSLWPRLVVSRVELGMPVFDRTFTTAIAVGNFETMFWSKSPEDATAHPHRYDRDGVTIHPNLEAKGVAFVYRKHRGAWRQVDQEPMFWAH